MRRIVTSSRDRSLRREKSSCIWASVVTARFVSDRLRFVTSRADRGGRRTFIVEVLNLGLKVRPLLRDLLDPNSCDALHTQGELGGPPSLDACDTGGYAIVVEIGLASGAGVNLFDEGLIHLVGILDEELAIGADEGGRDGDAGDGDGVDALVRGRRGGAGVYVGEEGGDIGTGGGDGDALCDARQEDSAAGEGDDGKGFRLRSRHVGVGFW